MSYPLCHDCARMKRVKVYQMEQVGDFEQGPMQGQAAHQQSNYHSWDACGDPQFGIIFWVRNSRGVLEFPVGFAPMVQFGEGWPGLS